MDQLRPPSESMPFPAPRRHSTVPTSFQPAPPRTAPEPAAANGSVETLYDHPSVKIVAFTAGKSAFERTAPGLDDKPGTLPSSSQFERSIAVGAFQIYRAPGSVAFLRSGSALQPILPKSQAWCLDEQSSKFVLQIRRPNYWRIEVPVGNGEEIRRALLLREVLDKILQFEKTPCPFERNFTVELPERPETPIKKRTWTPPARRVSMNWPPGQPITPPPEFPSRTRFYNPGARRFSDFGVDTSKMGLAPATPPQTASEPIEEKAERGESPSRKAGMEDSATTCKPLPEEPEPLPTPVTAIPPSMAQLTKERASQESGNSTSQAEASAAPATQIAEAPVRKREPIWITKKVPSSANRKVKRAAVARAQSADPTMSSANQPAVSTSTSCQEKPEQIAPEPEESKGPTKSAGVVAQQDAKNEMEAVGGALEGSGQLRVRRTRLAAFASRRAATSPPLRLRTPSTSTLNSVQEQTRTPEPEEPDEPAEPGSPAESLDSFHSVQSWHSPLSPPASSPIFSPTKTYPYPHENIPLAPLDTAQTSAFAMTPTAREWDRNSVGAVVGSGARTPDTPFSDVHDEATDLAAKAKAASQALEEQVESAIGTVPIASKQLAKEDTTDTDSFSTSWSSAASHNSSHSNTRVRPRAATTSVAISHRSPRALSPLPPAANLLTTDPTTRAASAARTIRRIPSSIFNKTCEILISPPAHLISLMLKVAARITAGEWQGFVFGMDEAGEVVDVRWDYGDDESDSMFGGHGNSILGHRASMRKLRESFAATDLSRPGPYRRKATEYQDPWATPPEEPDMDEGEHWSRSWGVD